MTRTEVRNPDYQLEIQKQDIESSCYFKINLLELSFIRQRTPFSCILYFLGSVLFLQSADPTHSFPFTVPPIQVWLYNCCLINTVLPKATNNFHIDKFNGHFSAEISLDLSVSTVPSVIPWPTENTCEWISEQIDLDSNKIHTHVFIRRIFSPTEK